MEKHIAPGQTPAHMETHHGKTEPVKTPVTTLATKKPSVKKAAKKTTTKPAKA